MIYHNDTKMENYKYQQSPINNYTGIRSNIDNSNMNNEVISKYSSSDSIKVDTLGLCNSTVTNTTSATESYNQSDPFKNKNSVIKSMLNSYKPNRNKKSFVTWFKNCLSFKNTDKRKQKMQPRTTYKPIIHNNNISKIKLYKNNDTINSQQQLDTIDFKLLNKLHNNNNNNNNLCRSCMNPLSTNYNTQDTSPIAKITYHIDSNENIKYNGIIVGSSIKQNRDNECYYCNLINQTPTDQLKHYGKTYRNQCT